MSKDICQICCDKEFKYSCPKCNILYCSVECYKSDKHQKCSEEFYRKCVHDEMSASSTISNDVQNMYNILKRIGNEQLIDESIDSDIIEENDSDDDDDLDMGTRLQGININDPDEVWSRLTAEEKHEFESLIGNGNITTVLPQFQPWWNENFERKLVNEIINIEDKSSYPEILKNIEPFEKLCKKEPSPCLRYNLCNILAAYTCTVQFFTGEHLLTPIESSKYIYHISTNLNKNENFDSEEQAINSIEEASNNGLSVDDYEVIYGNVRKILHRKNQIDKIYILAALSDLWRLFTKTKKYIYKTEENKNKVLNKFSTKFPDFQPGNIEELSKTTLNNLIKKIEFFLSFVNQQSN